MVDQKEEVKKEMFIETMPTMIQTHLIICKDWADVKDKAKSLEHIIQKCARSFCSQLGGVVLFSFVISFAIVPEVSITLVMH